MTKTTLNFNSKCRSCLTEDEEMQYLFSEYDQGRNLSDILRSTTYFEIEENDGLSPYLCQSCTTIVIEFYNFKTIYLQNENYIKSLYLEQNINETKDLSEINDKTDYGINISSDKNNTNERLGSTEDINAIETSQIKLEILGRGTEKSEDIIDEDTTASNIIIEDVNVKYFCEECGDSFSLKSDCLQHMLKNHNISIPNFEEDISDGTIRILKEEDNLENCNETIVLQCETCNENFNLKTYSEIEEHYKSHINYVCEQCGAGFKKKSYLKDHAEVHLTELRHICSTCGKAFKRRTVLAKHKKIHTHPRHFICEICGQRFTDRGTLNTHIKLKHTKERNFHCTICGLWFPLKATLMKHVNRHNDDRKREYICNVCHMAYIDKSSLNRHIAIKHTQNSTKTCSICGIQYTTMTNLLKHMRRHHKQLELVKIESLTGEIETDIGPC